MTTKDLQPGDFIAFWEVSEISGQKIRKERPLEMRDVVIELQEIELDNFNLIDVFREGVQIYLVKVSPSNNTEEVEGKL